MDLRRPRRVRALPGFLVLSWVACTAPNPLYNSDGVCQPADRTCVDSPRRPPYPVVCGLGPDGALSFQEERCPAGARCQEGLCVAPAGARSCAQKGQGECAKGEACVPLVSDATARTLGAFCVAAATAAKAGPGEACEKDEDCQTYLCLPYLSGNRCLRACRERQGCTIPDECRALNVTITGISGTIHSCAPVR